MVQSIACELPLNPVARQASKGSAQERIKRDLAEGGKTMRKAPKIHCIVYTAVLYWYKITWVYFTEYELDEKMTFQCRRRCVLRIPAVNALTPLTMKTCGGQQTRFSTMHHFVPLWLWLFYSPSNGFPSAIVKAKLQLQRCRRYFARSDDNDAELLTSWKCTVHHAAVFSSPSSTTA